MRVTRYFGKTLRQAPAEAETASHELLVRAGYIQQLAAGVYQYLPLGWRVQQKIANVIREEMDRAGAIEVSMPVVQPREIWEESGRAETYLPPLARFEDRRGRDMVLAPTHEEAMTTMAKANIQSYRDLPVNLYQVQTKFRDETRPRAGLLRTREFMMKDAYSFDADEESLDLSYQAMFKAYNRAFARCGLDVTVVEADSGAIGGKDSQEFVLLAENGEDVILICDNGDYAANVEKAEFTKRSFPKGDLEEIKEIATPSVTTIDELAKSLSITKSKTAKAVFYSVDGEVVIVTIRGDLEVNETKLRNVLGGSEPRFATQAEVDKASLVPGSASAVGLDSIRSIVDDSITLGQNYVAGANKEGFHLKGVNFPRDFKVGTEYSKSMNANFLDEAGEAKPLIMGCYGIGVSRLVGAIVEASHDERGMIFPVEIAPYGVYLASLNVDDAAVVAEADALYEALEDAGIEVLYDDRDEKPGVKFNDADLIGLPVRVVVSRRGVANGQIEIKERTAARPDLVNQADAVKAITDLLV